MVNAEHLEMIAVEESSLLAVSSKSRLGTVPPVRPASIVLSASSLLSASSVLSASSLTAETIVTFVPNETAETIVMTAKFDSSRWVEWTAHRSNWTFAC